MASVAPARRAAFQILMAVERGKSHSDDLLRSKSIDALSAPDRHLATALVLGVLRWQIQLDAQIRPFLKRPNARLDPEVRIALRLGAFQLLHLDRIPAHAAIGESVELARQSGHRFASGMVNAVLRKLSLQSISQKQSPSGGLSAPPPQNALPRMSPSGQGLGRATKPHGHEEALAPEPFCAEALAAHPRWMTERWTSLFGSKRTCAICHHDQQAPALTIRMADPEVERELLDAGIVLAPGVTLAAARTVTAGDITAIPAFREGRVRIQDEGSQLIAELAAAAIDQTAQNILDACAAPGGKTLILADRHPQARITACEASAPRLEQLRQRLAPLGERITCRHADVTSLEDDSAYDLVLADVPCSGTGTLSRNPEIRHRLTANELPRQAERQRAILRSALRAVRPGGRAVYSTCSLEPEENEQVISAVFSENPAARVVPPVAALDAMQAGGILLPDAAAGLRNAITPEGYLRLFPDMCATDGFFIAILQRTD